MTQNVTWRISCIIILCLIGHIWVLPGDAGEGWKPNFWSVLLEKPAIGEGGGMRSAICWIGGDDTFQSSLWGLGTTNCSPPPTHIIMTIAKQDCRLDLQSPCKKGLQVGMQSILAIGLWIWNAILSERILMMPAHHHWTNPGATFLDVPDLMSLQLEIVFEK